MHVESWHELDGPYITRAVGGLIEVVEQGTAPVPLWFGAAALKNPGFG